ncbi:MAG: cobalt-precorrin-5B (C(1))-methyltransferase [Bacteroidaceae bacterium]|nr:cobalt-precorrin-5B (C(1))-methyltransferase [Bacteroidaceae bacterium]
MILIFGGTTEGRLAAEVCEQAGKQFFYSTKSALQDVPLHNGQRLTGPMTAADIERFCQDKGIEAIIDAAHPFAEGLHEAIANLYLPVIRLQRPPIQLPESVIVCSDWADALSRLQADCPRCLLALSGVNTISRLRSYWQTHATYFRILRREESIAKAEAEGFPADRLLFYNDALTLPSQAEEETLMKQIGCDAIITKMSGESGGFSAKEEAARTLGIKVYAVMPPRTPANWIYVTGRHGLRRAIERLVPTFFPLHTGLTTGACATAAVSAAMQSLLYGQLPEEAHFALPDGEVLTIPVEAEAGGVATVTKDFSDDPDVTRGCRITARVRPTPNRHALSAHPQPLPGEGSVRFLQGEGVGRVTLPGLGIPVGEPAINPTPRQMMTDTVRSFTDQDIDITISVANGEALAERTFNHKVGVVGGISIIGTSGIVSPLSNEAFIESIGRELEVARAIGCDAIGLASGKRGEEALLQMEPSLRVVHYGNFIGESLKRAHKLGFHRAVIGIMIGKAVKLAEGHLDTHSHKVAMNKEFLCEVAQSAGVDNAMAILDSITMARELWNLMPQAFFDRIHELCLQHCRSVFPNNDLQIHLICDSQA